MNVLWLQSAGCGGCTMSLLCAESPGLIDLLEGAGISFLWHPAFSIETGAEVRRMLERIEAGEQELDVLCVEGSIARGPNGTGRYHVLSGTGPVHAGLGAKPRAQGTARHGGGHLRDLRRHSDRRAKTRRILSACNSMASIRVAFWAPSSAAAQACLCSTLPAARRIPTG